MISGVQKNWFFFFIIAIFFTSSAEAQLIPGKSNRERSEEAIMDLHDGALVVRLKSKRNKIEKLEASIASPALSEKDRKKLQKELETTIAENNEFNAELANAFAEFYTFSAVYFMYDTSSVALKNGEKSNLFLDKNLNPDPNITMTESSFFVVYNGILDAQDNTGMEALIIMDSQLEKLTSPFPYYIRVNNFWRTIERFFAPKNAIKRDSRKIVSKLDYNLNNYYKKVKAKN